MIPLTVNPAMDPIRNATWLIPRERPSSSAGVASTIIAALFVNRIADPRPCTARNAMTWAGFTAMLVRREPNVKTPKPLVYSFTRPVMSETRPIRRSATVLPRTYAWVIQIACSGSAWRLAATCGSPMITMRESRPAMSTPTVVTVRTVHLYWIRIAFHRPTRGDVRSPRGPGRRATKPQEYLNLPNHSTRKRRDPRNLRDADTLDRMMAGDQVPRHPEVSTFLSDRATLLRGLHGHGRMDDVPALLELDALHVEVPEDVRDEPVRLVRVLDHVDVLVHEPLQLRDVLALLPDRLADVPFLHDENQLVGCVDAVDDGRPREILEESDVFDRLFVKDNLDHAASGAEDVRVAGAEHRDGRDREGHPAGGAQVDVRAGELQQANLAEGRERVRRAVRRDDDDLRPLRWAPRAPRLRLRERERERGQEREEPARVLASEPPKASAGPQAAGRSSSRPRCPR